MAQAKSGPNWFAIIIAGVTVLALVGVGALVFALNRTATAPGEVPAADIINVETGAITFGDGPTTVSTYVDYRCPGCASFEANYGDSLAEAAADGTITLDLHPIAIMNHATQGTNYSSRAAGATYCVAESAPEQTLDFVALLFANQPEGGLTDAQITAFAEQVGAGAAADCISKRTYAKFADQMTPLTPVNPATGRIGTPTLVIDGELIAFEEIGNALTEVLG